MQRRFIPLVLFAALTLTALGPVRSYDSFWHLATGRWIVEHRALPLTDPFSVASDRVPWINGEWLFEVVLHGLETVGGLVALSWFRAVVAALIFTIAFLFAVRDDAEPAVAIALACAAFAASMPTLTARPSAIAALLVPIAIVLARRERVVLYALLTILWINVHPSALLAPVIWFTARAGARAWRAVAVATAVQTAALLVNPFGWNAIIAPLRLLSWVRSGEFVNVEWVASTPLNSPLFFILIAIGLIVFATAADRHAHVSRIALFVILGALAVEHVRNQGLFLAAYPLLVAPAVRRERVRPALAYAAAAIVVAFVAITSEHSLGPQTSRFPIRSVARLKATGLKGNVYNPDQFGGYLIWSFYPERRTLTDGRNELQHTFIAEYAHARLDERAWRELLRKHQIVLAVDELRPPMPVRTGATTRMMDASLAYWPRREWALIGYDEVSMVFAKRSAFPREVLQRWELPSP